MDDAARRLKLTPSALAETEAGSRPAPWALLRRMATVYALPLSTLLMPESLEAPAPPEDMRTIRGQATRLSPETLRMIREVRERQELAAELLAAAPHLSRVPELPRTSISGDPEALGAAERRRLGISVDAQLGWHDASEAFQWWRQLVEGEGLLVFLQPMPREDARGFCLVDEKLPAIVVNSRESDQAKSFTLFHEYAHVLLRSAALCLELQDRVDRAAAERFCNRFAASFLMPEVAVKHVLGSRSSREDLPLGELQDAARKLKVSRPALALRLEELDLTKLGYFDRVREELESETWQPKKGGGGPAYAVAVVSQLGSTYSSLVLKALGAGVIDRNTASELLNAPARQFDNIESKVSEHVERYAAPA